MHFETVTECETSSDFHISTVVRLHTQYRDRQVLFEDVKRDVAQKSTNGCGGASCHSLGAPVQRQAHTCLLSFRNIAHVAIVAKSYT